MKRNKTFFLIVIVISIWVSIAYRVLEMINSDEDKIVIENSSKSNIIEKTMDTSKLELTNDNPFLRNEIKNISIHKDNVQNSNLYQNHSSKIKNQIALDIEKRKFDAIKNDIKFNGFLKTELKKYAILSYKGKLYSVTRGDSINDMIVDYVNEDSVQILVNKKKLIIYNE